MAVRPSGAPAPAVPADGALDDSGGLVPGLEAFTQLARRYPLVPVTRRLLADGETPVGLYRKLAGGPGTFLLESAEHGRSWSRYSFVGVRSAATLTSWGGEARWTGEVPAGVPRTGEPWALLRASVRALRCPRELAVAGAERPPFIGGLVGWLGYDLVRYLERLPAHVAAAGDLPELAMLLVTDLVVLDHVEGSVLLVALAAGQGHDPDASYAAARGRLDEMAAAIAAARPGELTGLPLPRAAPVGVSRTPPGEFARDVEAARQAILAGEAFQVVLSQRFEVPTDADPLDIYRVLRVSNPSPYMYLLRYPDHDVVGSSPEALVTVTGRQVRLHPLAGTRPRGEDPRADAALAAELRADAKERAEHVMLVDLGRNDVGKVCVPGSVRVVEFGAVERFSHVMHLVSTITGTLPPDAEAVDVLAACFPAGTLSGAPKPRAMELIDALEPVRRGVYGGAVGYLDLGGDLDAAIAIRTAVLQGGRASVQAGCGVVADSDPVSEEQETRHKAAAVLGAIGTAAAWQDQRRVR